MNKVRDGDLYKEVTAFGKTFELRYGYYEDFEKDNGDPIPIYPNFLKEPMYTEDGYPFVTAMQDACEVALVDPDGFGLCSGCRYFDEGDEFIGICLCEQNRKIE